MSHDQQQPPNLTEEENQIIFATVDLLFRAINFKHRILNLSNAQLSDRIIQQVEFTLSQYTDHHPDALSPIWELNLSQNALTQLPNCLSVFLKVERLILSENQITSISENSILADLYYLKSIALGNNLLTMLPIRNCFPTHSLTRLVLSNNQLVLIPKYVGDCVNLMELDVCNNRLKTLPKELERCTRLMRLFVDGNPLFCLPYELRNLEKLVNFRCDTFHITVDKRFIYEKMYISHENTLLEFAKRFIVNSDHAMSGGRCCQSHVTPHHQISHTISDEHKEEPFLISIQEKTISHHVTTPIHTKINSDFDRIKKIYQKTIPKHLVDDLTDHTRLNTCNVCKSFMSPKSGINFICISSLPKKSKVRIIEGIPLFCRVCSLECFTRMENKVV